MITKLIDRVRASFCKDKQLQQSLYAILGFYPRNLEPYRIALVHKSQVYRGRGGKDHPLNNERLEYLGDAILEAVVSDIVFHRFPRRDEGISDRNAQQNRAALVAQQSGGRNRSR